MSSGKAYGQDRDYQVLCRDILQRISPESLIALDGDGVDVRFDGLGGELSHSLLNLAECDGRASYPQFTARRGIST